jgi:GNAT superfamily N-acetyltransferase
LPATPSDVPTIRRATIADAAPVSYCHSACWREAYAGLVGDDYLYSHSIEARRMARWRERLAGSRTVWLAEAEAEGVVVGVASAGPSRDDPPPAAMELYSLYVRASHYGTGLGTRLLDAAVGTLSASLWVFAANERAQRFYRRRGFVPDGAEKIDPDTGVPEIRMVRPAAVDRVHDPVS